MRSFGFTLVLALAALLGGLVAGWQWTHGGFEQFLGRPDLKPGDRLFPDLRAEEVKRIHIASAGVEATFQLTERGWQSLTPWKDRMDPRAAVGIIGFTAGMRVEDCAPWEETDKAQTGLGEASVQVKLGKGNGEIIANYRLGRSSDWQAELDETEEPVPTVFVRILESDRKNQVHIATGDINSLFKDQLRFLRDHRPFYFNPVQLRKIVLRTQEGELTLGRAESGGAWRITKPLDLATDKNAIRSLLEDLYELQAVRVMNRDEVTLPTMDTEKKTTHITVQSFGSDEETTLEIFPPDSPDAVDAYAVVSDRPNTVLLLPRKPEPGLTSVADLLVTVNDLRDPTLTNLRVDSIRGISIKPATGPEILINRQPPKPWMATVGGGTFEANEENLFALLKAVTDGRAIGYESDAVTDFTHWGLDRPILVLRFLGADNQAIGLRFGLDGKGGYFANRLGSPSVVQVDPTLVSSIAVRPHEWRLSRIWSLDRVQLLAIRRVLRDEPPLILKYSFVQESWKAESGGGDRTASLDPLRANQLLTQLEGLKVFRWLAADDAAAIKALEKPELELTATELLTDQEGESSGVMDRTVRFAHGEASLSGFVYGQVEGDPNPFLLELGVYQSLLVNPLDEQSKQKVEESAD